jgi:glycosyltransferase involved in cell wall biosynthesis
MKKRIVHVAKATGIYGMEKHLLSLLPGLNRSHEVICILLTESKKPVDHYIRLLRAAGITVYPVMTNFDIDPKCFFVIAALMRRLQPALVHTHLIHGDCYGIAAAWLTGCRSIVSTRHNDDSFRRRLPVRAMSQLLAKRLCRLIAISNWVGQFARQVERIPAEKIVTIYYGLEPLRLSHPERSLRAEFGYADQDIVLGIPARLVEQKGHGCLIEAFAQARTETQHLKLLIAGEGPLRPELEKLVREKNLADAVCFTGYRHDIGDILAGIDVFVHPSLWEGFGLSILEAMAMGKPVLATRVSAIPELVGDAGILVPAREPLPLAKAITTLARDGALRGRLGQQARERWERHFSLETMVRQTASVYDAVLRQ